MDSPEYPYRESLLQWIWQELEFNTQQLKTTCGRDIKIIENGRINKGAGPDFLEAVIRIGSVKVFGDVEVHIHPAHWNDHNHSRSKLFNRVCLHVAYTNGSRNRPGIRRPDGTEPPLLLLEPYLQKSLRHLFEKSGNNALPCSGNVSFINQEAFERQVQKAHRTYFEYKTGRMLQYYDSHLSVSAAWKKMFSAGLFDTLGIPRNRPEMVRLNGLLSGEHPKKPLPDYADDVSDMAFGGDAALRFNWKTTGMRPQSHPRKRVRQAASLHHAINCIPFKVFLSSGPGSWEKLLNLIPGKLQPGGQMEKILHQTVFYPALYLLGDLLHSQGLKRSAYQAWMESRGGVPESVLKPFKESGFRITHSARTLGLAHQLKRYCRKGNCNKCEVFKKAISP